MFIEKWAGMMDKDLETVSLLRNSKGSFHQKMSGMERYPVLLGTARGGGPGGEQLQVTCCKFIPVGELAGHFGNSKTAELYSHEFFL